MKKQTITFKQYNDFFTYRGHLDFHIWLEVYDEKLGTWKDIATVKPTIKDKYKNSYLIERFGV